MAFTVCAGQLVRVLATIVFTMLTDVAAMSGSQLRGGAAPRPSVQEVSTQQIELSLQASLRASMLGSGRDEAARQIAAIEASMWPTFQALPKDSMGRLAPRAVRHLVQKYFAKQHGWIVKGLEPHGMQISTAGVHDVSILKDRAPALVEALLEARHPDYGLSLADTAVMAAALERLIFKETSALVQVAYFFNDLSSADPVDYATLYEVLWSYLIMFEMGTGSKHSDIAVHHRTKARVSNMNGSWALRRELTSDTVLNFRYAKRDRENPFAAPGFSAEDVSEVAMQMLHNHGQWQNDECLQMKQALIDLNPDGSGRVPLSTFYSRTADTGYQFRESIDYLRQTGMLDESSRFPRVIIPNYVSGSSNCVATSTYFSVCCLSDCEDVMDEIAGKIQAPTASPERLLSIVGNISTSSVDAPRQLSNDFAEKLRAIAERHGGGVPVNGRLFAQWLHYAFPNECPYPHIVENTSTLVPRSWSDKSMVASREQMMQYIEVAAAVEPVPEPPTMQWSDEEVLVLNEPQVGGRTALSSAARVVVQLAAALAVFRMSYAQCAGALAARSCADVDKGRGPRLSHFA